MGNQKRKEEKDMKNTRKENMVKRFLANTAAKMRNFIEEYERTYRYSAKTYEAAWL